MSLVLPTFDQLPAVQGMPQGCAWGVFDHNDTRDVLGTLNILTPHVVRESKHEIVDGISISLNWPLEALEQKVPPFDGRRPAAHHVFTQRDANISQGLGWDDELEFNTQGSSQWDSLVHWQHQASGLAYNGAKPSKKALLKNSTAANFMPTLDHWHSRGGLVGRGVLIDYLTYAEVMGLNNSHRLDGHRITVKEIEAIAAYQHTEFKQGDIFILRTGLTEVYENPSSEDLRKLAEGKITGVDGSVKTAKWFWNKHFAAVAADNNAFEAYPPLKPDGTVGGPTALGEFFLRYLVSQSIWDAD
ncbi:hypothetical protein FSARC_15042, partial [Fusarium sarcochroum]